LRSKDQVKKAMAAFVSRMETQFEGRVKKLQSRRGGKYWNKDIQAFCKQKGIIHQKTNPYSSQENGVAERLNRTLMEKARAMLSESGLDHRFWGEAVLTANFVRNRTGLTVHGKTPLEMLTGKKPHVDELRVFGSRPTCTSLPQSQRS
jgi:transposase InsO family protein